MFTLEDVWREYRRLDRICRVDTSKIQVKVSKRAVRRRGSCVYTGLGVKEIRLSDFIFTEPADLFYDTVRHEYAHAVVKLRRPFERHGHDEVWKSVCLEVGCSPNRLASVPAEVKSQYEDKSKYVMTCTYCGAQWKFYRKTRLIKGLMAGTSKAVCPKCRRTDFELTQRAAKGADKEDGKVSDRSHGGR